MPYSIDLPNMTDLSNPNVSQTNTDGIKGAPSKGFEEIISSAPPSPDERNEKAPRQSPDDRGKNAHPVSTAIRFTFGLFQSCYGSLFANPNLTNHQHYRNNAATASGLPANLESPTSEDMNEKGGNEKGTTENKAHLPPVDGGKDAWLFLAASTGMEAVVFGYGFAFGVFEEHYTRHGLFANSNTAVVGTCAMGIMYLSLPILFAIYQYWPEYQQRIAASGVFIMCLGLGLASLVDNLPKLVVCQGLLYAVGGILAYAPCLMLVDDWFDKKKGLAYGVMWAGSGVSGIVLPIALEHILDRFGFRVTLRGVAVVFFILTTPLIYLIRPRIPVTRHTKQPPRINLRFLLTPTFGMFELCNIIEALGFFLPSTYLPSYARSIGARSGLDALTVILVNVASAVGCIVMGTLIDRYDSTKCILLSTMGTTLGVFFLWGFSLTLPPLFMFCIVYGLFAGSFTTTWSGCQRDIVSKIGTAEPCLVLSWFAAGRGIGNVASGPLSALLVRRNPWKGCIGYAYGSDYGTLIMFTGATALFGGSSYVARWLEWI